MTRSIHSTDSVCECNKDILASLLPYYRETLPGMDCVASWTAAVDTRSSTMTEGFSRRAFSTNQRFPWTSVILIPSAKPSFSEGAGGTGLYIGRFAQVSAMAIVSKRVHARLSVTRCVIYRARSKRSLPGVVDSCHLHRAGSFSANVAHTTRSRPKSVVNS